MAILKNTIIQGDANVTGTLTCNRVNSTNLITANRIQIAGGPNLSGNPGDGGLYFGDSNNCYIKEWINGSNIDTDSMLLHVGNNGNGFHFDLDSEIVNLHTGNDAVILNHERNDYNSFIISSDTTYAQLELNGNSCWAKLSADGSDAYITVDGEGNELGNDGGIRIDSAGCGGNITMDSGDGIVDIYADTVVNGTLTVTNRVNATYGFFQTSDIREKNVIGDLDLDKAYELIDKCQTILYTLKDDENNNQQVGLIAQEVKEFFPELITEDEEGVLSLNYSRLTVIILRVLKDVIDRVKKLENK